MSDLAKRLIMAGGTIVYTLIPATNVSADDVAKIFSNDGQTPVGVVEGETAGKGNLFGELRWNHTERDTKVTGVKGIVKPASGDLTPNYVPATIRELPMFSAVYCWS
jgi:hypothetical protein